MAVIGVLLGVVTAAAQPDVHCEIVPLPPVAGADLGGRFHATVIPDATGPYELTTVLLVLDRAGEIVREIPVQDGDEFQFGLRDEIVIKSGSGGPFDWLVLAPGVLFRTRIQQGFQSQLAYCSPYAAIRVDQPEDVTFVATTASPDADAHLVIGVAQMKPESIRILVDCVDITQELGATFPGGPFNGSAQIAGETVTIEGLASDFDHGIIAMTLKGLPGGAHLVHVEGTPVYVDDLPTGAVNWRRPLGALYNNRTIAVFRVDIQQPGEGAALPLGPVSVIGEITHAQPPTSLRVHGVDVPLPAATFVPGDGCVGDKYVVAFSTQLGTADIPRDLTQGDASVSGLDPGVNFVSALATDAAGHVPNDRVRFTLGEVAAAASAEPAQKSAGHGPTAQPNAGECDPAADVPGFVSNGFGVSLSERALAEAIRKKVLPGAVAQLQASLNSMVGTTVESQIDPCPDSATLDLDRTVNYQGQLYDLRTLSGMLAPREDSGPLPRQQASVSPRSDWDATPMLNDPPTIDAIGDQTTEVNKTVKVDIVASDPDGDDVSLSLQDPLANAHIEGTRFEFHPACDQIGQHTVTIVASDGTDQATESFVVTVNEPTIPETYNAEFVNVTFDPSTVTLDLDFAAADRIDVVVNTGAMVFGLHAGDCYGDCLLDCCLSWGVDFRILIDNIVLKTSLTPQQILCGVSDPSQIPEPTAEVQGLDLVFDDVDIGGVFGWLTPEGLLAQILDAFGVPEALLNAFARDYILDQIHDSLQDAIVNQFPGFTFAGLRDMEFSTDLPAALPVTLETRISALPTVTVDQAISMGIHTNFTAKAPEDPLPPWHPTASGVPQVGNFGADFLLGISDDMLNELMAELASAGTFRDRFEGFTVGDFVPGYSLPALGISSSTPILLTIDAAQNSLGDAVPPIIGFIDDPATPDVVELKVRTQFNARAILPRGQSVGDDRNVCSCLSYACSSQPCLLTEQVIRLNFLIDLSLSEWVPGVLVTIGMHVSDIQELTRDAGFDSFEASDFRNDEDQIVNTTATSPLLAQLRDRMNAAMPPMLIPPDALTLGGWVTPSNLRLFAATVDDAGLGYQDYFGLLADVVPESAAVSRQGGATGPITFRRTVPGTPAPDGAVVAGAAAGGATGNGGLHAGLEVAGVPLRFGVRPAFPNPFNPSTTVTGLLPAAAGWALTIYNAAGEVVRTWRGHDGPGEVPIQWDGTDGGGRPVSAGVYVYRFETNGQAATGKLALVK